MGSYVIGVDYGTNSVRAVVAECATGREVATHVFNYPSGVDGILVDPADHNLARQNPADYIRGLEETVTGALAAARRADAEFSASRVVGIGVDTTGSTPIPVDDGNRPLAMSPRWSSNLAAHAWLWKDHTSFAEAARITEAARAMRPRYLAKYGGVYSSEWFWSKLWHCLATAPDVFDAAASWVELADYIPSVLAGVGSPAKVVRGVCAAGHKAMYCEEWGGLPDAEFLSSLHPKLGAVRARLFEKAYDAATPAGALCPAWAGKLGLPAGIPIAIGAFDAHYGAVGAGVAEGTLVKIIGTSSCDCTVAASVARDIPGICGTVKGSILPGLHGIEAGQSAVGDIFKWFVETLCKGSGALYGELQAEAAALRPGQSGLLALDWNNGNRNVLADPRLTGLLVGQTLHTTQAEVFRALVEATAFGAKTIVDRLMENGVKIERIVCCGGLAERNPMLMQIYADVTGCDMLVAGSSQTCALGAAMAAAVLAGPDKGGHKDFPEAQARMATLKDARYSPRPESRRVYARLYECYKLLHDAFGGVADSARLGGVMKTLLDIKNNE